MNVGYSSYDEDILVELCERVTSLNQELTINNFLTVFIEAEELL